MIATGMRDAHYSVQCGGSPWSVSHSILRPHRRVRRNELEPSFNTPMPSFFSLDNPIIVVSALVACASVVAGLSRALQ